MDTELSRRELAMLRAVAAGRGELLWGYEPDLAIDGAWCDFTAVHHLVHAGLIRPAAEAHPGQRVPAEITHTGRAAICQPWAA